MSYGLRARLARVYPMYVAAHLPMTVLVAVVLWEGPGLFQLPSPGWLATSWVANLLTVRIYAPDPHFLYFWNNPGWSISCEFAFYAAFPFFTDFVLPRLGGSSRLLWVALPMPFLVAAGNAMPSLPFRVYFFESRHILIDAFLWRGPFLHCLEFFMGCVTGEIYLRHIQAREQSPVRSWTDSSGRRGTACYLFLAAIFLLCLQPILPGWWKIAFDLITDALFTLGFAAPILLMVSGPIPGLRPLLEHRVLEELGEASYSLYITHWIPYSALLLWQKAGHAIELWMPLTSIAGSIALSVRTLHTIETPARRWLTQR